MTKRFWEIDSLRGFAIVAMVLFHLLFDIRYLAKINLLTPVQWYLFPRIIGGTFIFLVGLSLTLGKSNVIKRGAKVFAWGAVITAVTWIAVPETAIWFGILHFIGLGIMLSYFFKDSNTLLWAGIVLFVGLNIQSFTVDFPWFMWIGLLPKNFYTLDYYPLIPWFGILLLGMYAGKKLYAQKKRNFQLVDYSKSQVVKVLALLGRHSLMIYLVHQPVLIGVIYLLV